MVSFENCVKILVVADFREEYDAAQARSALPARAPITKHQVPSVERRAPSVEAEEDGRGRSPTAEHQARRSRQMAKVGARVSSTEH